MADTRTACAILKSYPLKKAKLFLVKSKAIFCKKKINYSLLIKAKYSISREGVAISKSQATHSITHQ